MESEVVLEERVRQQRRGSLIQRLIDTLNDSGPWLGNRVPPPPPPKQQPEPPPEDKAWRPILQRFPRAPVQGGIVERQLLRLSAMDWWGSDARFARARDTMKDCSDEEEELSYDSDEESILQQQQQQQWSMTSKDIEEQSWRKPTITTLEHKRRTSGVRLDENVWTDEPNPTVSRLVKTSFAEELEKALRNPSDAKTALEKQRREHTSSTFEHMALSRPTPLLQRQRRQRRRPKLAPDLPLLPNLAVFTDAEPAPNDEECEGSIRVNVQDSATESDGIESCVSDQVAPVGNNGVEDKQDVWAEGHDDSELVNESKVVPVPLLAHLEKRVNMQELSTATTNLSTPANTMNLVLTETREQAFKQEPESPPTSRHKQEEAWTTPQIVLSDNTWSDTELRSPTDSPSIRRRIVSAESMETRWRQNLRREAKRKSADMNDSIVSQILRRVDRSVRTHSVDARGVQPRYLSPARTPYPPAAEDVVEIDATSPSHVSLSQAAPSTAAEDVVEIDANSPSHVALSRAAASTAADVVEIVAISPSHVAHSEAAPSTAAAEEEVEVAARSLFHVAHSQAAASTAATEVELLVEAAEPAPSSLSLRVRSSSLTSSEGSDSIREMPNDEEFGSEFELDEADTRRTLVEALEMQNEKMHALLASLEKVDHDICEENRRLSQMENALKLTKARRLSVIASQERNLSVKPEQQELMKALENGRSSCRALEAESFEADAQLVRLQGEQTIVQRYRTEVLHSLYEVKERRRVHRAASVDSGSAEAALLMRIELATDKLESVQTQVGWLRERRARAQERSRHKEEQQHEQSAHLETLKHELLQLDEEVERAESARQQEMKRARELLRMSVESSRQMQIERRAARAEEKQQRATVKQLIFGLNTRRTAGSLSLMRSQTREATERTHSGLKSIRRRLKNLQQTLNLLGRKKKRRKKHTADNTDANAGSLPHADRSTKHKVPKAKKRWKSGKASAKPRPDS